MCARNITLSRKYLKFTGGNSERSPGASVGATVEFGRCNHPDVVSISDMISPNIRSFGRLGYLFNTKFHRRMAILKLVWTPTVRMPEGAIYEHLHRKNVAGIPQVFASGILVQELFEYRLEFMILENCGCDISKYLKTTCLRQHDDDFESTVTRIIKQTFTCLLHAKHVGVLHRDISAGNITIRDDKIFVIDWGLAKLIATDSGDTSHMSALAKRWGYSEEDVQSYEDKCDAITGTTIYMGIRILANCSKRGILDDLESLFYLALHILICKENRRIVDFLGCRPLSNVTAADVKVSRMSSRELYLESVGIRCCPLEIKLVLDRLHERLFFVGDKFIGPIHIVGDTEDVSRRILDDPFVVDLIGNTAFERIFGRLPNSPAPLYVVSEPSPGGEPTNKSHAENAVIKPAISITEKRAMDKSTEDTTSKRQRRYLVAP